MGSSEELSALIIPIKIDALLVLPGDGPLAEAKVDFSRLPYNDGKEDVNNEFGYISENFISQPFQNNNLELEPGVHLHWALPDAFTKGKVEGNGDDKHVTHTSVPDRWIINRKKKETETIQKSWVVESNYLHPKGKDNKYHAIAYPYQLEVSEIGQPFRYMGRSYCFYDATKKADNQPQPPKFPDNPEYLPELTAVGYGEHTFAAFYPNCHSVFGFHDSEIKDLDKVEYEVLGWYSDGKKDPIKNFHSPNGFTSGALNFDGIKDFVTCPNIPETKLTDNFTIEAWIKPEEKPNICSIVTKKVGGSNRGGYALGINKWNKNNKLLVFEIGNKKNSNVSATSKNPLIMDQWQHVAVVVVGTTIRMYINAVLDSESTLEFDYKDSDDKLRIGAYGDAHDPSNGSGYLFKGSIGEVRIWNMARTQDQIQSQRNTEFNTPPKELVAYYKFNQGIANRNNDGKTTLVDRSGNSNHGVLKGFLLKEGQTSNWVDGHPSKYLTKVLKKHFNFDLSLVSDEVDYSSALMSLCYGEIQFNELGSPNKGIDGISIGSTGAEALSAMLAQKMAGDGDKKQIEEKLEALQLGSKLAGKRLDLESAFAEAYHEKGFSSTDGGHIWSLRLESMADETKANNGKKQGTEISLPDSFAHWINKVNQLQQEHDRAKDELKSLQRQLYADWCKYMTSAYHSDIEKGLPQMDEVRFFIENQSISSIDEKELEIQELTNKIQPELAKIKQLTVLFNCGLASTPKRIFERFVEGPETDKSNKEVQPVILKDPALGGVLVKQFDGTQSPELIAIKTPDDPNKIPGDPMVPFVAISFWVQISSKQPSKQPYALLKIVKPNDANAEMGVIAENGVDLHWQSIYINGISLDPFQIPKWKDFPKDQWIHVYLRGSSALTTIMNIELMPRLKGSLAGVRLYQEGLTDLEIFCDQNMLQLKELKLVKDKGPRYWQPNEPVVLISGDIAKPTERYGFDGELPCMLIDLESKELSTLRELPDSIREKGAQFQNFIDETINKQNAKNPWHPLLLEWKVGITPLADGGGINEYKVPSNFITDHYVLAADRPDLIPHPTVNYAKDSMKIFSGSTILTPHAKFRLTDVIERYLENLHESDFDESPFLSTNPFVDDNGKADPTKIADFDETIAHDTISIALEAYKLIGDHKHFLSQSFGGFNAALQMLHQTFQLPIADPIGFKDDQAFAAKVKAKVQRESKLAPLPLFEFDPIRTGDMQLLELNIIDSFGQIEPVYPDPRNNENALEKPEVHFSRTFDRGQLPPRIAQPARINFRWLSANHGEMEMNEHPVSSPLCGWLVPNNIDGTVMVYDHQGYSLGAIQQKAKDSFPKPEQGDTPIPFIASEVAGTTDNYKPLSFFEERGSTIRTGFDTFSIEEEFYFTYSLDGLIYLMSEGYTSRSARDNGRTAVEKNMRLEKRYKRIQVGVEELPYFVLKAGNNQELAKSRPFISEGEREDVISHLQKGPATPERKSPPEAHHGPIKQLTSESLGQIPNPHLREVAQKIASLENLTSFMDLLEKTMDQIDPENFAQHTDLAMLIGRPIAVVRASVGLEVKGQVAVNQGWDAFMTNMTAFLNPDNKRLIKRTTNDWEKVKFPVRIGEHGQLNDGVLGYWLDQSPDQFLSTVPKDDDEIGFLFRDNPHSQGYDSERPAISLSPAGAQITMTLLMDPRGKAHASCGILPSKLISIPDDQYKPALKNMSVTFFTRPLLMPLNKLAIPLPNETGYSWSWLEKSKDRWTEISTIGMVHKESFTQTFGQGEEIWIALIKEGWITPTENDKARVMPQNKRNKNLTDSLLLAQFTKIQDILDAGHIVDEAYEPNFSQKNRIKEGWLKLTPDN